MSGERKKTIMTADRSGVGLAMMAALAFSGAMQASQDVDEMQKRKREKIIKIQRQLKELEGKTPEELMAYRKDAEYADTFSYLEYMENKKFVEGDGDGTKQLLPNREFPNTVTRQQLRAEARKAAKQLRRENKR